MRTKEENGIIAVMFAILIVLFVGVCVLWNSYTKSANEAGAQFYVEQSNTVTNE